MLGAQSRGVGIHSSGVNMIGSVTAMQPITRSRPEAMIGASLLLALSRVSSWYSSRVPLPCPKTSHACQMGNWAKSAKRPNPPIALCGDRSLKKNGSPGCIAANVPGLGRQKLTSVSSGRARRNWYQLWSVGATKPRMACILPARSVIQQSYGAPPVPACLRRRASAAPHPVSRGSQEPAVARDRRGVGLSRFDDYYARAAARSRRSLLVVDRSCGSVRLASRLDGR
jgi:hypothetical protein